MPEAFRVRLAAAAPAADSAPLNAVEPLIAERVEGGPARRELRQVVGALDTEPSQTSTSPRAFIVLLQVGLPNT